jgi:hypothetical protein
MLKSTADTVIAVNDTLKYLNFISIIPKMVLTRGCIVAIGIYTKLKYILMVSMLPSYSGKQYEKSVDISQMMS